MTDFKSFSNSKFGQRIESPGKHLLTGDRSGPMRELRMSFASCIFSPKGQCSLGFFPILQMSKLMYREWSELSQVTEPEYGIKWARVCPVPCHGGSSKERKWGCQWSITLWIFCQVHPLWDLISSHNLLRGGCRLGSPFYRGTH